MVWTIAGVPLPNNPSSVMIKYSTDYKEIPIPGQKSLIISLGRKVDSMRIEGAFVDPTKTPAQIEDTYLKVFEADVGTGIAVTDGDATTDVFDGTWILSSFTYKLQGGYTQVYKYTMEFILGDTHVELL